MVFDITQLKKIRKQVNLTQFQFAQKAGVSQSMIAKIESGRLDPTYTKVKKIENALNDLTRSHEKEARDFCNKGPISVETLAELLAATWDKGYNYAVRYFYERD